MNFKRVLSALLIIVSMTSLSACNYQTEKRCYECNELCPQNAKFCGNCGTDLMASDDGIEAKTESQTELADYSRFGFQNNYGMNEWMTIRDYNFQDKDNPYVLVSQNLNVIVFEDNMDGKYYLNRYFSDKLFKGDSTIGDLGEILRYNTINNSLIEFQTTNYPTWEIKVIIDSGIPIINGVEERYDYKTKLIPTYFIDWSRELEGVIVKEDHGQVFYNKYYIKCECVE